MSFAIAFKLGVAFVSLRESDNTQKTANSLQVDYDLEYGSTDIHVHRDDLDAFKNVSIIFDLLETGETILLAIKLINGVDNKNIMNTKFFIYLPKLGGSQSLDQAKITHDSLIVL